VLAVASDKPAECLVAARVRELNGADTAKVKSSLQKLHENLGHPGNQHLVRLLKHGGASPAAQELAKMHACPQCPSEASTSIASSARAGDHVQQACRYRHQVCHWLEGEPEDSSSQHN